MSQHAYISIGSEWIFVAPKLITECNQDSSFVFLSPAWKFRFFPLKIVHNSDIKDWQYVDFFPQCFLIYHGEKLINLGWKCAKKPLKASRKDWDDVIALKNVSSISLLQHAYTFNWLWMNISGPKNRSQNAIKIVHSFCLSLHGKKAHWNGSVHSCVTAERINLAF